MKICADCGEEKTLDEFYDMAHIADGKDTYCISCRKERSRQYRENREPPETTSDIQAELLRYQIKSVVGSAAGYPYIDLVAFGSIPIEAKGAYPTTGKSHGNCFHSTITKRQREVGIPGFIVFVAYHESGKRFFVLPSDLPLLWGNDGRMKNCISFTMYSQHHNARNWEIISQYENQFWLIWKKHLEEDFAPFLDHYGTKFKEQVKIPGMDFL